MGIDRREVVAMETLFAKAVALALESAKSSDFNSN